MAKLMFVLVLSFIGQSALTQSISQALFYPQGSVPKRFEFFVNDTLRSTVHFGDSRFENMGSELIGYHENGFILDSSLTEPIAYPNTFIDKLHADTISIQLFSLPNLPFGAFDFSQESILELYTVPVFIESAALNVSIPIKEIVVRVPFPDSLFPPNAIVTYPDSADIKLQASYIKAELLTDFPPAKRVRSIIELSMNLSAEIKPFIGSAIVVEFPLLNSYSIEIYYFTDGYGFGGFKTSDYEVQIGSGALSNFQAPLLILPGVELKLNEHQVRTSLDQNIEMEIPYLIELAAYPNPFNPSTSIRINLFEASSVDLILYSIQGELVQNIFSNASLQAGNFEFRFDGSGLSSGVYFVQARVFSHSGKVSGRVLKVTLLK